MKRYLRRVDDDNLVLDIELLDMSSRCNLEQHCQRWAYDYYEGITIADLEQDFLADPRAIVSSYVDNDFMYMFDDLDEQVAVQPDTLYWMVYVIVAEIERRLTND